MCMYVCMYVCKTHKYLIIIHFVLYTSLTVPIYTSRSKYYEVVIYTDDVCMYICMYVCMYVCAITSSDLFFLT